MRPITAVSQVFEAIQMAKAGASAFCTNFFPVQAKVEGWVEHQELLHEIRGRSAFFLKRDRDFWHLYFCAPSVPSLQQDVMGLPALKAEPVTADLVGTEAFLDEPLTAMESCGFRRHARLLRLARPSQPPQPTESASGVKVTFAESADAPAALELLEACFERYTDQIPAPYEMDEAIRARQVLVVKDEGALAALLFFETQGLTSTVRYWVVDPRFRAHRFGSALIRHYFAIQPSVRRFVLWVTAANDDAVMKYSHYGYGPDGLVDHVLVNDKILK